MSCCMFLSEMFQTVVFLSSSKMESFVRSKYESRRWALDGPLPIDPSILEDGTQSPDPVPASAQPSAAPSASRMTHAPSNSLSGRHIAPPIQQSPITTRQPQPHQLLSTSHTNQQPRSAGIARVAAKQAQAQAPAPPQPKAPENDLFTLDFHAPASVSPATNALASQQPKKDVKQDILSLFSTSTAASPPASAPSFHQFSAHQNSAWGTQQQVQPTSMIGSNGTGVWGASSGWNGAAVVPPAQGNLWGNPTAPTVQPVQQANLFGNNNDVWGAPTGDSARRGQDLFNTPYVSATSVQKKDDVFGDLWGGFK